LKERKKEQISRSQVSRKYHEARIEFFDINIQRLMKISKCESKESKSVFNIVTIVTQI